MYGMANWEMVMYYEILIYYDFMEMQKKVM